MKLTLVLVITIFVSFHHRSTAVSFIFDPNEKEAHLGQFPSVVYVLSGKKRCGGTLISPSYVLSAAHCIVKETKPRDIKVWGGLVNLKKSKEERVASKVFVHEKYNKVINKGKNDIALIKLKKPFKLSRNIKVAKLPVKMTKIGAIVTPVGWGLIAPNERPNTLRYTEMAITKNIQCHTGNLCAIKAGVTACSGDSGGPFFAKNTNTVVGVINAVKKDPKTGYCSKSGINLMADVYHYLDWINEHMKK